LRVLVTGASGFVGRAVVARLRLAGVEVLLPRRSELDLLDESAIHSRVPLLRASHLVHLAWATAPGLYWDDTDNHRWVSASLALLRAFAEGGGQSAVYVGSCAEYRWQEGQLDEANSPLQPHTRYGLCKAALGLLAPDLALAMGLRLAWARLHFPYGPGEAPGRLVPQLVRGLLAGQQVSTGPASLTRDFIHVTDVADALWTLLKLRHHGVLDLCSGTPTSVAQIAEHLADRLGRPDLLRLGSRPARAGEPQSLTGRPATLVSLGWRPNMALSAGLDDCIAWWRANNETGPAEQASCLAGDARLAPPIAEV
jgi:nucleoside-diphosphate-sugar epimerase